MNLVPIPVSFTPRGLPKDKLLTGGQRWTDSHPQFIPTEKHPLWKKVALHARNIRFKSKIPPRQFIREIF
jgi:hypothetical protein